MFFGMFFANCVRQFQKNITGARTIIIYDILNTIIRSNRSLRRVCLEYMGRMEGFLNTLPVRETRKTD